MLPKLGIDISVEYFGILFQKAQKAPRILAVDKGILITNLKFLLQLGWLPVVMGS